MELNRGAVFSACYTWRYSLTRSWPTITGKGKGKLLAIMLNPSKADHKVDDPTTTFMVHLAQREGFQRYEAVNLFALVSTDPTLLYKHPDPVGAANDDAILKAVKDANEIIVAWGNGGLFKNRASIVTKLLGRYWLWCFGTTKLGMPRFPRAVKSDVLLQHFRSAYYLEK